VCACVSAYEYAGRDLEAGTSAFQVGNMHVFSMHTFKMQMICCEMQMLFGYAFLQKKKRRETSKRIE